VSIAEVDADVEHLPTDLTESEAVELTGKIGRTGEHLSALIQSAWRGRVWIALGHASWAEWAEAHLAGMQLPRVDRQELVAELHAEGLSTRAIAAAVGASKNTVTADLSQIGTPANPDDDIVDAEIVEEEPVTATIGLDGKTYQRPDKTRAGVALRDLKSRELAGQGMTSRQIAQEVGLTYAAFRNFRDERGIEVPADAVMGKQVRIDPYRIIEESVSMLEGIASGLALIEDVQSLDAEKRLEWIEALRQPLSAITRFQKELTK
jgi:predicted transcriptional regulator/lambda repressor-like predicted transcriptional regulator